MGFGLLLIGYFCVNVTALFSPLAAMMPIGYVLMLIGLWSLAPYGKYFLVCRYLSFFAVPFGIYYALRGMADVGLLPGFAFYSGIWNSVIDWLYFAFYLVYHVLLLYAVSSLAAELCLDKIKNAALRNLAFLGVYQLAYLVASLPIAAIQTYIGLWVLPLTILRLACTFLNVWLFFCCYRQILPEGSDTSPRLRDLIPPDKSNKEK